VTGTDEFTGRYVAVWNEPDPDARAAAAAELWGADAHAYTSGNEYRGIDAITGRVAAAYAQFVAGQGFVFTAPRPAESHHGGMRVHWEMGPAAGGGAVSGGVQFLLRDTDGRIRVDYQFIDF
jgi:hypothetical protein